MVDFEQIETVQGKVKWFDAIKGYGFIESNGTDYFVHYSEIKADGFKTLEDNQNVTFVINPNDGRPKAEDVRKA